MAGMILMARNWNSAVNSVLVATYLYFHFCLNMLRFAWRYKKRTNQVLESEPKKYLWGTDDRYMKKSTLQDFTKETGKGSSDWKRRPVKTWLNFSSGNGKELEKFHREDQILVQAISSRTVSRFTQKNLDPSELESSDGGEDGGGKEGE